jgi:hypothetical protein
MITATSSTWYGTNPALLLLAICYEQQLPLGRMLSAVTACSAVYAVDPLLSST